MTAMALRSLLLAAATGAAAALMPWQDWTLPITQRVEDMLDRLSLADQIQQTWSIAPSMNLSGVVLPAYNWRSNCVHGWAASGGHWLPNETWTNFPTPLGMGATWDPTLARAVGEVTSTEGRALHNLGLQQNNGASTEARGLNCFAPNVNVLRHQLYGRNQELQSEDPVHLSAMTGSYLLGLQVGEAPQYLKVAGCLKHYAIHDGPESDPISREAYQANISMWQAWANYFPQFRSGLALGAASVMCAYSATNQSNGAPDCASQWLLGTVLRGAMDFGDRQVISDNGALEMIYDKPPNGHAWTRDAVTAAAAAINAGADNDLGYDAVFPQNLQAAIDKGLTTPAAVRQAARRNLLLRLKLGEFDPDWLVPYKQLGAESLDTPAHRALNLQAARESIVLLKNGAAGGAWTGPGVLPLALKQGTTVALIGPSADDQQVLLGNYQGIPGVIITVKDGLTAIAQAAGATLNYAPGCLDGQACTNTSGFAAALSAASGASAIVFVGGLDQDLSREGHDWDSNSACNGQAVPVGGLPGCQLPLLQALKSAYPSTPLIVVDIAGNPLLQPWENANASALIYSAYPGNMGGQAIAEVLTGAVNPGGRLPYTLPAAVPAIQALADNDFTAGPGYSYRYVKDRTAGGVTFPFGYGLSYTTFAYSGLTIAGAGATGLLPCSSLTVTVNVTNTGSVDGDEVVQLYVGYPSGWDSTYVIPHASLKAFTRVTIPAGVTTTVTLTLPVDATTVVDWEGFRQFLPGTYALYAGGQQPGYAAMGPGKSCGQEPLTTSFTVPGTGPVPIMTCPGATQ